MTKKLTYYKATRPDGTDFRTGTIDYAAALASGEPVMHPYPLCGQQAASHYLSISTVVTDCTGMAWPCRLFEVSPVGRTWMPNADSLPNKRACVGLYVLRELPPHRALGPQGEYIVTLIERARRLPGDELSSLAAAWDAAWDAARDAARVAAWVAAWDAAWDAARVAARVAAWVAAWDAAGALNVRDLIRPGTGWDQAAYDLLTTPWRRVIGPIHPDDRPLD